MKQFQFLIPLITFFFICSVSSQDLKVSLAQMPVYAESPTKGVLVDFVNAIAKAGNRKIHIQVVPFQRSMNDVINRNVDFHMPLIQNPNDDESTLKYDHSTETIFHVNFTLYTHKNSSITKENVKKHKIETDLAHVQYFDFPIKGSSNLVSSMMKLNAGRIDGFIFADVAIDPIVSSKKLNNVKRELFYRFDVKVILPKGENGKAVDTFLTNSINKLRKNGEYERIMGPLDLPFKK